MDMHVITQPPPNPGVLTMPSTMSCTSPSPSELGKYVRMLFIDYSPAVNPLVPHKLQVNSTLCSWVTSFMKGGSKTGGKDRRMKMRGWGFGFFFGILVILHHFFISFISCVVVWSSDLLVWVYVSVNLLTVFWMSLKFDPWPFLQPVSPHVHFTSICHCRQSMLWNTVVLQRIIVIKWSSDATNLHHWLFLTRIRKLIKQ